MKEKSLKKRIIISIIVIVIYSLGKHIPLFWVVSEKRGESLLGIRDFIAGTLGDDADSSTLFSLGIMPWMTASIVFMLFKSVFKQNEKSISQTKAMSMLRIASVYIALFQAFIKTSDMRYYMDEEYTLLARLLTISVLTIGSVFVVALGDFNKENGIGQYSLIIMVNILANFFKTLVVSYGTLYAMSRGIYSIKLIIAVVVLAIIIVSALTITFEMAEIRIPIQHVMINNKFSEEEYIAVKLSPVGTMPIMYTMTMFFLPFYILKFIVKFYPENEILNLLEANFNLNSPVGIAIYLLLLCILNRFLAEIMVSPEEITENMQKVGDYIPNIRAGRQTKKLIKNIVKKASRISSFMFVILSGIPLFTQYYIKVQSPLFMLPMTIMILISIEINILEEIETRKVVEQYRNFL